MSSSNDNDKHHTTSEAENEYTSVKALIRDLHTIRNVSRPDEHKQPPSAAIQSMSDAEKLLFNRFDDSPRQSSASDIGSYNEGDAISRSCDVVGGKHLVVMKGHALPTYHHHSNYSLNIPSVIVTDANEHADLFSSTQRRFSQLYSGLRRFSVSHTV